jgi:hypothetical protein
MNRRQFVALLGGVSAGRHRFEGTRAQPWVLPRDRLDPYFNHKKCNANQSASWSRGLLRSPKAWPKTVSVLRKGGGFSVNDCWKKICWSSRSLRVQPLASAGG